MIYVDKLIRCVGRLGNSQLSGESKTPVLIPTDSYFTKLLISRIHIQRLHSGVGDGLAALRQNYWAPRARQKIRSILRKCVRCLRVQGKPYKTHEFANLPVERVVKSKPFQVSGIDYTGALNVRNDNGRIDKCLSLIHI